MIVPIRAGGKLEDDRYPSLAGCAMATLKPNVLQLTRGVDPNAIAIFLNYRLQPQGITATAASERTQTAKNREDWQQVSNLWREAIDRLESITPLDQRYIVAQRKITEYQRNFVYAQQQFQAIPNPMGLGVTRQSIQSAFESGKRGFRFRNSTAIEGQPRVMGQSASGLAMLELIGPAADLTKVTIVVGLPEDDTGTSALNRIYMLKLLQQLIPEWNGAADWLTQSTTQLADGQENDLITIRDHKRVKLSAIGGVSTLVLVIEPN